jgi:hypothetical protein
MQPQIEAFKNHVRELAANPSFFHHQWFVKWHLEVVERLALELAEHYPQVDKDLVVVLAWLHDYGKMVDFENQYQVTLTAGREALAKAGFPPEFIDKAIEVIEAMDKKMESDLHQAQIEVQLISSADGCSHMVGPFYKIFWNDSFDKNFEGRPMDERIKGDLAKVEKDWARKIVLPEARAAFLKYYEVHKVMSGEFPEKFFV